METISTIKSSPARRWTHGILVEGTIELTQYYIAFKPTIATEYLGFLQWSEFKNIRRLRRSLFRPPAIQITRINDNHSLILCIEEIEEWMSAVTSVHFTYTQSTVIEQNLDPSSSDS